MNRDPKDPVKVLIVDDDDVDRERIRRLLGKSGLGVQILEATSASEALVYVRSTELDCALVDYRLGDTMGMDLLHSIKSASLRPLPVIMVTGLGDERVAVEAMRSGVFDYLAKAELGSQQLRTAIEGCLRRAKLEAQLAATQERLTRLSMYDELTGLPNRNLFFDRLEQAVNASGRGGPPFALLMMDLNLLKDVNDSLGHSAGDELLAEFGRRLQSIARKTDTYARLGGDEFGALLLGTDSMSGAIAVAEKIAHATRAPMALDGHWAMVSASTGIALFPAHGADARCLLSSADHAMYRAKRAGRDYEVYAPGDGAPEVRSCLLLTELPRALTSGELFLHYQPKIDLARGDLVGVEALVRWQSSRFGLLGPAEFVPAAERSSLVHPLTYAILDMALNESKRWHDQGTPLPMAVNLSARVLDDERLASRVSEALATRGLPPQALTLEITETALMTNPNRARSTLNALHEAGVRISIDDFGTGYTSLKYLREFAISEIKLDRLFISRLSYDSRDASIVRSISVLSSGFDIDLVAEGIESLDTCGLVHELGCDIGQGYAIGHPMPASALSDWRTQHAPSLLPASGTMLRAPDLLKASRDS